MKKNQILIVSVSLILVIICITLIVVSFATDTFKSDKELFFKYAKQIKFEEITGAQEYPNYLKKLSSQSHNDEGILTVELKDEDENISESIEYTGYSDPSNNKSNYDISLKKENEELLSLNYLRDNDLYGVLFNDIVNQYIVLENNNLKEFASKLGVENTDSIPDKFEVQKISDGLDYDKFKTIYDKYLNIALEQIPKDNYSKIKKESITVANKKVEADGYLLKLDIKDIQNILIKMLETAKDDKDIYNEIEKIYNSQGNINITFEEYQSSIEEFISEISTEISEENNSEIINICVYKKGKETIKLDVNIGIDEIGKIEISAENKQKTLSVKIVSEENEISFIIKTNSSSDDEKNIEFDASYKIDNEEILTAKINGSFTANEVKFNGSISINIDENQLLNINIENQTNFSRNFRNKRIH